MKKLFEKDFFWCLLILLASLIIIGPLLQPGFYPFHDEPQIANLYQMIRALSSGQIPPRWAPDMSFNYGYPLFNFYYPLPFYLGSCFYFIFKTSHVWSLKLVFLLSMPLSGLAFYFLMRKFFSKLSSFSGAAIYLFTPYRAVDLYVRGAIGELWSFVFMPLVLLTLINLIKVKNLKNISFFALSMGGFILSHNLTPIIFLPFVVIWGLVLISQQKSNKLISSFLVIAGLILGLAISAYYWLPAVLERKVIQPGTPFNPIDHFPFLKQLIIPFWGYGASVWGPGDDMSFQIGIVNLFVVLAVVIFFWRKFAEDKKKQPLFLVSISFFFICIILMNIRSLFFWRVLPLGNYIQFPWRFLMMTTFFSSFLVGFIEDFFAKKKGKFISLFLALLAIGLTTRYFKPEKQLLVDDNYYLRRFFANRTTEGESQISSKEYQNYSEDYLPLTVWTEKRPSSLPARKIEILKGEVTYQMISGVNYEAIIETGEPSQVLFHSYYFPGWIAILNGQKAPIRINEPYGDILIQVPTGKSSLRINFSESPIRYFADLVSLFSLAVILMILVFKRNFNFDNK